MWLVKFLQGITCICAMSSGLDGLGPFTIKDQEDKLQTVDAQVQQCPSTKLFLSQAGDVGERSPQVSPNHLHITHLTVAQQSPHFQGYREETCPDCLDRRHGMVWTDEW